MTLPELPHLLEAARAWARGSYAVEAAVELLAHHGTWLHRRDFLRMAVEYAPATYGQTPYASISWDTLHSALFNGLLPCSNSEAAVLRIALSLAEGHPVDLGPAITRLDRTNLAYVLAAIRHAGGDRHAWASVGDTP
ncbi:hypothetical protein GCM10010156_68440 [Planobispora rosea]|uniref:Uncharacterized protein n=1 Tax=Planobispora rosea TaxID=35762 RepID=A0A8J3WFH2_PLARO|nr:hypothetical protein [Planobispora rosea]GGT00663.1 hypothetical protein GCM10010156_68440 [Planobispora rosea]GIH88174.1 hypothetical protein Pro02_65820 [Planobispora rosea]